MKTPLILAALTAVCLAPAQAKPATKPGTKPAQKPAQTQPLLGTAQLPGDNGKLEQAYTMGERGKVNVVLTGVRYAKERWIHDESAVTPDRDHKLMILSFQIQNPNKEITRFNGGVLKFTAIDQEGENHEGSRIAIQKSGVKNLSIDLKPAQRIDCETAILVPAKGMVPKLMVAHESGGGVLRYDLHDAIKGLQKPYSADGVNADASIPGEAGTFYSLWDWDVKYQNVETGEKAFGHWTIDDNKSFVFARLAIKKAVAGNSLARINAELISEDGDRYPDSGLKKGSLEEGHSLRGEQGQEMNTRMAFSVPKGVKIVKLRVWEGQNTYSHAVEFPMDLYATMDMKPLPGKTAKVPKTGGSEAQTGRLEAQAGVPAEEYSTIFRRADGSTAMEIAHVERREGAAKTTEITIAGKRALLMEEADATTLYLPDTNETLRAPKAKDKEPMTSLSYYAMAYANATAPKLKKRSPFGDLGKAILSGGGEGLGQSIMSSDSLSNFGKVAVGKVVENSVQRTLTNQLGRAVMTSAESLSGGGRNESVVIDKKVYAETTFKAAKTVDPESMKVDASAAKSVDAKELYKRFAEFMGQGLK